MISISERLRARQEPVGDGSGKWRKDGLCQEAADTLDAIVWVLEKMGDKTISEHALDQMRRAALKLAKGDRA